MRKHNTARESAATRKRANRKLNTAKSLQDSFGEVEIRRFPDLTGYFCQRPCEGDTGLHNVKVGLPYLSPVCRHPALIERTIPPWERGPIEEETEDKSTGKPVLDIPHKPFFR